MIHSGLTLLQIPEGVDWDGEVVKVVVGIAGKDGEHLDLLSKIATTFSEEGNVTVSFKQNLQKKLNKFSRRQMHNESSSFWCW